LDDVVVGVSGAQIWSVARHPDKPSLFVTGTSDGCVKISFLSQREQSNNLFRKQVSCFDSRVERWPLSRNKAHAGPVWQVQFAPAQHGTPYFLLLLLLLFEVNVAAHTFLSLSLSLSLSLVCTVASVGDDGACLIWRFDDDGKALDVHQVKRKPLVFATTPLTTTTTTTTTVVVARRAIAERCGAYAAQHVGGRRRQRRANARRRLSRELECCYCTKCCCTELKTVTRSYL
jgi:WD40 repeat protein